MLTSCNCTSMGLHTRPVTNNDFHYQFLVHYVVYKMLKVEMSMACTLNCLFYNDQTNPKYAQSSQIESLVFSLKNYLSKYEDGWNNGQKLIVWN